MKYIRSPLRVSLFGGGTDFADYFQNNKGKVIGFAINRFVNIFGSDIELNQDFILRLSYRINEEVNNQYMFFRFTMPNTFAMDHNKRQQVVAALKDCYAVADEQMNGWRRSNPFRRSYR